MAIDKNSYKYCNADWHRWYAEFRESIKLDNQKDRDLLRARNRISHKERLIYVEFIDAHRYVADEIKNTLEQDWPGLLVVGWVLKPGAGTGYFFRVREVSSYETPAFDYKKYKVGGDYFNWSENGPVDLAVFLKDLTDFVGIHGGLLKKR